MPELMILVRAAHFAGTIAVAGTVIFRFMIAEPALGGDGSAFINPLRRRWSWIVGLGVAVAVASGALWLLLLASDIFDVSIMDVCRQGDVFTVAAETRFGQVWLARAALVVALLLALRFSTAASRLVALLAAAALLGSLALVGHSGAVPGLAGLAQLAIDLLHLFAAGLWLGGLPALALTLAFARRSHEPDANEFAIRATRRFSSFAMVAVAFLFVTGIASAWRLVGSVGALLGTDYGRLVLLKIGLFVAMLGIAAVNRLHLTPRLREADSMRALQRNCLAEIAAGVLVLIFVGALGTMAPAAHQHDVSAPIPPGTAFVHIHTEAAMAEVTLNPGRAGPADVLIRLLREDFSPLWARRVTLRLSNKQTALALSASARPDGEAGWRAGPVVLPAAGVWTVEVDVALQDGQMLTLDGPIVVEP